MTDRQKRRALARRKHADELYAIKRAAFEVEPVYKGWLWWARIVGWRVTVLRVEGASCAAPMGRVGYLVPVEISDVLPTKLAAYRWLIDNVRDYEDYAHYQWGAA